MSVMIRIPTPLRPYVGGSKQVDGQAGTVEGVLAALAQQYPDLQRHLFSEQGKLRSFVNVYLGDEDVRYLKGTETVVPDGATLSIVPSVAGGAVGHSHNGVVDVTLSNEEIRRYSRHLIMPEVGMGGQKRLKSGSVLLVGAGGLGSPAAMYLAAAGVGRIGIMDFDVVDESNLQRQIIHGMSTLGKSKLESARARIHDINPFIQVDTYEELLTSENATRIFADYDVIADGTDNFPTRYLVNDACVLLGKPNVYGSIFRFEGQASVFWAERGPCYRCLYPEPPPPGLVPSCAEGGVLGVLPGVIGVIQATEVVKLLIGEGESLVGRLLLYDALDMKFRELKLRKDPTCPICGEHPTIDHLIDYEAFCGTSLRGVDNTDTTPITTDEISVKDLQQRMNAGLQGATLLDVREPHEWEIVRLPGAKLIPRMQLPNHLNELSQTDDLLVYCRSGVRSAQAVAFLKSMGFRKARNIRGGILAWAREVDPSSPVY
ncbi:MAG: molybdopterin-synthase adenylyltransferase MoeB [Chloroflexi bacterium]|nr:molybdopterin-synthase adenylyltransferase MoeB [Chloroflexota bacterium]MCL5273445.1 molybdopterin-synthase adenylyltransferase MoeB [Chloroflexota bacterium]